MKRFTLVVLIVFAFGNIYSQTWQPFGVPPGGGVTDMVYWMGSGANFSDKVWVSTSSYNWPTGQWGGVYYSATTAPYQGVWYQVAAGYIARTLAVGQDGKLYASIWYDPAFQVSDGLYRFNPQAGIFGILYQIPAGDNIFSIAVKNTPHTIFAGTRNGLIRSTDNGVSFGYSNTGIPDSSWVYDIAIDSSGILAIASSKGVFITTDNGDNWQQATGIVQGDTIVKLLFDNDVTLDREGSVLMSGSESGNFYTSTDDQFYLNCAIVFSFTGGEVAEFARAILFELNQRKHGVAIFPRGSRDEMFGSESGFYLSTDNGVSWVQENSGLPPDPKTSALTGTPVNESAFDFYIGLFEDTSGGARVYHTTITTDVKEIGNTNPPEYKLNQNYPNPFNPSTTIKFSIPEHSYVKLEVFNSPGEKISTLVSEGLTAGNYKYDWNAANLPSGIYFYRLSTNNFSEMKKMILLK